MSASIHTGPSDKDLVADTTKNSSENVLRNKEPAEVDEFGLPVRPASRHVVYPDTEESDEEDTFHDAKDEVIMSPVSKAGRLDQPTIEGLVRDDQIPTEAKPRPSSPEAMPTNGVQKPAKVLPATIADDATTKRSEESQEVSGRSTDPESVGSTNGNEHSSSKTTSPETTPKKQSGHARITSTGSASFPDIKHEKRESGPVVSEWSHQALAPKEDESDDDGKEVEWQAMPAIDEFDVYDDYGRLVARGARAEEEDLKSPYANMAGFGKGYTRVLDDEDARSATSMDDDTDYLFKKPKQTDDDGEDDLDDDPRDALAQLEATKDLLTEGQRIAYVGVVRLMIMRMVNALGDVEQTRGVRKDFTKALEDMDKWGQGIMVQLYRHMDIDSAEQIMIEQLAEHGLQPEDLVPPLMQNAKVKNPMSNDEKQKTDVSDKPANGRAISSQPSTPDEKALKEIEDGEEVPQVHGPESMPSTDHIDLDIRWTVLCDLFLVLVSSGAYDARSRRLLERVGSALKISWVQICRFEKRVVDQLEVEDSSKERWDESEHIEDRRKKGLKKKYVVMGLATVGGGLVIGLSAGLLAPVIGAGLAAGFTTIGVTGTAGFLGGVGGAALITSAATAAGGTIAVRASHRRTGHVQTFEYRPLHNNKRLNLILTVSGWMTGKVDDVRLPFSTVDPIMGDIYSLLWEPDMLRSMGDTINILATEALTSSIQQVLGATMLAALMASIQLPVVLTKLAYLIDNPWTVSLDRANSAGLILADSLIARHLGQRPVTLLGFSLGSRVIFSCLRELADRGAHGIVQNVYLFGSPIVAKKDEYLRARSIIAGRFVNGYASNDWILGYLFRATSGGIMKVAGLAPVENIPGLENIDVTELVNGHMAYRAAMPRLLKKVGWEVESEEFTEIEDPDPENHAQRQRELIREIDAARKQAAEKPQKKRFGLFKRGKLAEKQNWENYAAQKKSPAIGGDTNTPQDPNANILFDIDAIRKELISEQIEIRELDSTLPPMQFTTIENGEKKVEYLRLPPEIKPEDVARMRLPPRPDEIDNGPPPPLMRNGMTGTTSTPSTQTHQDGQQNRVEISYAQPKDMASIETSNTASSTRRSADEPGIARPSFKKHDTEPTGLGVHKADTGPGTSMYSYDLEDNAWADNSPGFGKSGEIKMTFE